MRAAVVTPDYTYRKQRPAAFVIHTNRFKRGRPFGRVAPVSFSCPPRGSWLKVDVAARLSHVYFSRHHHGIPRDPSHPGWIWGRGRRSDLERASILDLGPCYWERRQSSTPPILRRQCSKACRNVFSFRSDHYLNSHQCYRCDHRRASEISG